MRAKYWLSFLACAVLAACGGDEAPENAEAQRAPVENRDTVRATAPAIDMPDSMSRDELDDLRDQLDELPERIIPYVPAEDRLTFASAESAREALVEAIVDGDIERADLIFGSVDSATRDTLLAVAIEGYGNAVSEDDYARAHRFDVFAKIDYGLLWRLDGGFIKGRLLDADSGAPVGEATVTSQFPGVDPATSGSDGHFELFVPPRIANALLVKHPDYEDHTQYQTDDKRRLSPGELGDEVFVMRLTARNTEPQPELPSLTFRGRVVDAETGEPLNEFTVVAGPPKHNTFDIVMKGYGATTGADGRFEIRDLPVNDIAIHAQGVQNGKLYLLSEESITFEDGVEQEYRIEGRRGKLDVPVVVVGFVRDRVTGEPIARARVSAGGWKAERTGPDGRFLIQLDPGKDWQLTASHEAYHESAPQAFSSPKPQRFDTEFLLNPITTGTILGTAINSITGEPIANAVIEIAGQRIRTDSRGRFRAEEVESGDVTVNAAQSGFRADTQALVLEALQTAEATLELEPITTGTIRGIVVDATTRQPIAEAGVRAGDQQTLTDADGRFVLENVEAGMLEVAASKSLYVPNASEVALEAMAEVDTQVELTPITWGTVTGVVREAGSGQPLADASVRIGANIVKTNSAGEYVAERVPAGSMAVNATLARYHDAQVQIELPRDGVVEQDLELAPVTTGTIRGVVRNARSGEPVGGADLTIATRRVRSNADGSFEMTEVPAGRLTVSGSANLYEPGRVDIVLEPASEATADLALEPITYGTVRGTVTNATTGAPLANTDVRISGRIVRTDASGVYRAERVPAGDVSVSAERYRFYPAQETARLAAAEEIAIDLALAPITTGSVEGIVRDAATGRPLPGVNLVIGGQGARSNAEGVFRIDDVPAGDATLRASARLYESNDVAVVVEAAESATTRIDLTPITYGTISGQVVDANSGSALGDVDIAAGRQRVRTGVDGRFTLEKVPAGTVRVAASKPVYVENGASVELAAGDSRDITIELEPITWGSLRGVVTDAETRLPLANAEVTVAGTSLRTDASGRFTIERIQAGALQVSASAAAYEAASERVTLPAAGDEEVTLQLVPIKIGNVAGQVIDAKTGEPVAGARVTLGGRAGETDGAGRFRFDDVSTGSQVASAKHPDYANGSASAKVLPAETVEVVIRLDLRREDVTNLEAGLAKSGTIDLYGIYFNSGKDEFKPSSLPTLRAVLEVMKRAPQRRFELAGHTDADGSDDYNQDLSERRARRVIEWLVDNGIEASRLDAVGYGETRPVAPNDTESGKALNRRAQLSYAR